jgi:hypothetical protein
MLKLGEQIERQRHLLEHRQRNNPERITVRCRHPTGTAASDSESHLPRGAGGHEPVGDGSARASLSGDGVGGGDYSPYGSSEYVADSSVPGEIVIRVVLS